MRHPIEIRVYPDDCDAYGHLNQASFLVLFERARWDAVSAGPGFDVFRRNGVWPAVRKTTIEYYRSVFPGEILRFEVVLTHLGRTSFTMHQVARRDGELVAEGDFVFVCIDRDGKPAPVPEEIGGHFGTRPSVRLGPTQHRSVRGTTLAVDIQGEGSPILLIHGFPLDRSMWRHQMATLAGWRRIAPDLRAMGLSDVPESDWSFSDYADDLVELLDRLEIGTAVVTGLSMGGYVALDLIRRHPERVRALILANTRAAADTEEQREGRDRMIRRIEADGPAAIAEELVSKLLGPVSLDAQPRLADHLRTMIRDSSPRGLIGALRAMKSRPDATEYLPGIEVPCLVVAGSDDRLVPVSEMKAMADAIPDAQFTRIHDAGHLTPLEQPIATNRVIGEFLDALA